MSAGASHSIDLTNQFLIAMPGMVDGNFAGTVVYLCEHSDNGVEVNGRITALSSSGFSVGTTVVTVQPSTTVTWWPHQRSLLAIALWASWTKPSWISCKRSLGRAFLAWQ